MNLGKIPAPLVAVCTLLGFLLVTTALSTNAANQAQAPEKGRLIGLIQTRRSEIGDLDAAVTKLRSEVAAETAKATSRSRQAKDEAAILATLNAQAGTISLKGKGVTVSLSDSKRTPPTAADAGAYRIHDTDLQLVVNALFAAGAEAVAVNDSRVVATTAIRAAGDTIVVNFRPLTPPYKVTGIGASASAFNRSDIAGRFGKWTKLFGLGFSVKGNQNLTLPPYTGRVGISLATPKS
ncbi:MAG: hypothetical protein QOG03_2547 [Actinomycetota bacterium]|nr:hypothetical protein [Actinomycetota bacterium]